MNVFGIAIRVFVTAAFVGLCEATKCWSGLQGTVNGQTGNSTFIVRECLNPEATCIRVKYCKIDPQSKDDYEYGTADYCEGEKFFEEPENMSFKGECRMIRGKRHTRERFVACTTMETTEGRYSVLYNECCHICEADAACNKNQTVSDPTPCDDLDYTHHLSNQSTSP
ncbi:hypothetical protein AB6A40_001378 [Gnathostoma spinigerum]|uniref:Secreted protein n=1 Tax=Gnathostoma spinigerum TaxID=75299 RepID=A0ABD6E407_9BILA